MQDSKKIRESVTGFLVNAVTNNIGTSWVAENQKKIKIKLEQNKVDEEKSDSAESDRIKSKQKTKNLLDIFHALHESEQAAVRRLFEKQTSEFLLNHWNKEKESNQKPEGHVKFSAEFSSFFEVYQANLQLPI